jgi:hypothetical protein
MAYFVFSLFFFYVFYMLTLFVHLYGIIAINIAILLYSMYCFYKKNYITWFFMAITLLCSFVSSCYIYFVIGQQ